MHFILDTLDCSHDSRKSFDSLGSGDFCFHVYTDNSLVIDENGNVVFCLIIIVTRTCDKRCHRAGSQLKMTSKVTTKYIALTCVCVSFMSSPSSFFQNFCFHAYMLKSEHANAFVGHLVTVPIRQLVPS